MFNKPPISNARLFIRKLELSSNFSRDKIHKIGVNLVMFVLSLTINTIMLGAILLSVIMLNVIMLNVVGQVEQLMLS